MSPLLAEQYLTAAEVLAAEYAAKSLDNPTNCADDATGEVIHGGDASGTFNGAVELAHQLAASDQVRRCFSTQWFRYAFGRVETDADTYTLDTVHEQFASSDHDVRELIVAIALFPTFRAAPGDAQ